MEQKKNTRCTQIQIQLLQKYMANNKTIATTTKTDLGPTETTKRAREWSALRALLRKHGPDKSVEKWKQTWRDLKRKFKKQKLDANQIKVESKKSKLEKKSDLINNDFDITVESSTVNADPLESVNEGVASIKEEPSMSPLEIELPSIDVNLDIPCTSPMQVVLTNAESFASTSSTSTQTSKFLSPCCTNSSMNHSYYQCCHQNSLPDAIARANYLQNQNTLLQRICNLLEEQNSNLRLKNRIERLKIRFPHCRRF